MSCIFQKFLGFIICKRGIIFKVHFVFVFQNECPRCNKFFSNKSNLQKHIDKVHVKTVIFECKQCDYKTKRKYNLTRHSQSVHNSEPKVKITKLKCEWCLYETNRKSNLERHVKSCKQNPNADFNGTKRQREEEESDVLDEQPSKKQSFSCEYCDYTAADESHIARHRKSCHKLVKTLGLDKPATNKEFKHFEPVPLSEHMDVLETILPTLDPAIKPHYADNFRAIRSNFSEPRKDTEEHINHAFYNIRWTGENQSWKATLDTIFRRQDKRFKINHAHSFILYNKKLDTYRYFHASRHVGRVLPVPKTINNYKDLKQYMEGINKEDMWEWAKAYSPDSDWTVAAITSTTFFVDRLQNFPIGCCKSTLPITVLNNDYIDALVLDQRTQQPYTDHNCFFRCVARAHNFGVKQLKKPVKLLAKKWKKPVTLGSLLK